MTVIRLSPLVLTPLDPSPVSAEPDMRATEKSDSASVSLCYTVVADRFGGGGGYADHKGRGDLDAVTFCENMQEI